MSPNPLATIGIFMLGASAGSLVTYARDRHIIDDLRRALEGSFANVRASADAKPLSGMKVLVLARDAEMVGIFTRLFREIQIETQQCALESEALDQLLSEKFDALVLDIDQVSWCAQILKTSHGTRPNQNAVVFAVATGVRAKEMASALPTPFIIERPFVPSKIRDLVRTVYGRMLRDRLAYFRLALELPISIGTQSGTLLQCMMINLSQSGMAVSTPSSFDIGEQLHIVFAIPNSDVFVRADGTVIWDDRHGKAGIRFQCTSSSMQARLSEWLHDQFFTPVGTGSVETDVSELSAFAP